MGFTDLFMKLIDIVLHLDQYLGIIVAQYGVWTYLLLFLVLFVETGVVIMPFLPGDSLLFTAGTMAGIGIFKIWLLFIICFSAAVIGDNCNYWIGHFVGSKIVHSKSRLVNKKHIDKTQGFFDKYGTSAIILARFMPIIRTFTPFLAGMGSMKYWKFLIYDTIGGFLWVSLFLFGGYFFGGLQFVKDNFSLIVILIIFVSFIPLMLEVFKHYRNKWRNNRMGNKS